jgi:hypothetical protein
VPATRLLRAAPLGAAALALLATAAPAAASGFERATIKDRAPVMVRSAAAPPAVRSLMGQRSAFSAAANFSRQHDGTDQHLPPASSHVELVGKLEMNTPAGLRAAGTESDAVLPGQIADLAVHKNYAYLNSWDEPTCKRGGTFIVDISNPASPQQVGFLPALPNRYHGEGAHVVTLNTPVFQGDILAVNNEQTSACSDEDDPNGYGGFDLYDVTNPRDPKVLVQGIGDTGEDEGTLVGDLPTPRSSHSTFVWQGRDRRAYVVFVDNIEVEDVDIFEITDPKNPRPVAEHDFVAVAAAQGHDIVDNGGLGGAADIFLHDMVVKEIGSRFIMMANYWDAGYLTFDVTDPANPVYIGDSSFDGPDPLTGHDPQEGNGHQGEFSRDNQYILAADEDFSPYRPGQFEITTGPEAGVYPSVSVGGGAAASFLPDLIMNGPTVYGGYGCDNSDPIPQRNSVGLPPLDDGEEAIIVLQRGPSGDPDNPEAACFPGEKAENGINAGYDAVLLVNHHAGEAGGVFCGSGDFPASPPIVTVCTTHEALHHIFGEPSSTTVPYPPGHGPPLGDIGEKVKADSEFDGWGYTHLIAARTNPADKGKMATIDSYAIKESLNPNYAFGFGDLSVHEFATDPDANVAYSSYYSGGMRVFTFGPGGLVEQGRFIDQGGSNFWGVEVVTTASGERLFAGSDRDYGLYLFRYTGPNAVQKPQPPAAAAAARTLADPLLGTRNLRVGKKRYVRVPVSCAESFAGKCRGKLSLERRNGWTTLALKWFAKRADVMSNVKLRLKRSEFRRLVRRKRQRVTVELITRGIDGQLRQASTRLTLLAPRR